MEDFDTRNLKLLAPLRYTRLDASDDRLFPGADTILPGEGLPPEEWALCFDLDRNQARAFEPGGENYLGDLVFRGKSGGAGQKGPENRRVEIPAGEYLFAQKRSLLSREEVILMAMEVQKDGLWERRKMNNRLYVRFLYEDGAIVSQVFRALGDCGLHTP